MKPGTTYHLRLSIGELVTASEPHLRCCKACLSAYANHMHVTWDLRKKKVQNYHFGLPNSWPVKPAGRIKVATNKKRTSYLTVASLNDNFLRKYEEAW